MRTSIFGNERLQPLFDKLKHIAERMDSLRKELALLGGSSAVADRVAEIRKELRCLMRASLESPLAVPPLDRPHRTAPGGI